MKHFGKLYEESATAEKIRDQHKQGSRWWDYWDRVRITLQEEGDRAVERIWPKGSRK